MKDFHIKRANGAPTVWPARGENHADALERWEGWAGKGFAICDADGRTLLQGAK